MRIMHLGQHMTNEQKANLSAICMGREFSSETRTKISVGLKGNTSARGFSHSEETKAKESAAHAGHAPTGPKHHTIETRTRLSATQVGHVTSPETRAKMSMAAAGPLGKHWKGGPAISGRKHAAKRRLFGYVALNAPFVGCEGHHVDNEQVIHIPGALHQSIWHCLRTGQGMAQMNALAYNYLFKQEVEALIPKVTS